MARVLGDFSIFPLRGAIKGLTNGERGSPDEFGETQKQRVEKAVCEFRKFCGLLEELGADKSAWVMLVSEQDSTAGKARNPQLLLDVEVLLSGNNGGGARWEHKILPLMELEKVVTGEEVVVG